MADLSDPSVKQHYAKVRKGELDWLVLGYGGTRNVLTPEASGKSIADLQKALTGPVQYVYVKCPGKDVFFIAVYTSSDASSLLKAKSAVHKRNVGDIMTYHHLIFSATSPSDFDEAKLQEKAGEELLTPSSDMNEEELAAAASGSHAAPSAAPVAAAVVSVAPTPAPAKQEPTPTPSPTPAPVATPTPTPAPAASAAPAAKKQYATEEDEMLAEMTEEELAKLLEETGLDKGPSADVRAEPLKGSERAAVFVYEDPAVKQEKKAKELEEIEAMIEKIAANSNEVPAVVNFHNTELMTDEHFAKLGEAIKNNTVVQELLLANCNVTTAGAVSVIEGLTNNKTVVHLNLESNCMGPAGLEAIAKLLSENNTLKELRITNQRGGMLTGKPEREFLKALEKNTSLQKLGYSAKDQTTRNQIDKFIFRNKDLARQARLAEKKK